MASWALALAVVISLLAAASASAVVVEKPVNVSPPVISGSTQEGSKLKAKKGEWTGGNLVYAYQWQRCEPECTNIATATGAEYTTRYVDIGAELRLIVTASNSAGSAEAVSAETSEITAVAPRNIVAPVVSGLAREGQLMSVSNGEWNGTQADTYTYQWEHCTVSKKCTEIAGATEPTYRAGAADVGFTLRASVTALVSIVSPPLSRSATSAPTEVVKNGPPVPLDLPALSGQLRVGGVLEVGPGKWAGTPPITYSFEWERCNGEGVCEAAAAGSSYTIAPGDVGDSIRVSATASNSAGSATSQSVRTAKVLGSSEDFAVGWGEDYRAQLGTIYRTPWEDRPVLSEGTTGLSAVAMGSSGGYALHADGTVTASGAGEFGTIGYGGRKASWEQGKSHVMVKGLDEATEISAEGEGAMALLANGGVMDWGNNGYGTLGNGKGGFEAETGENQLEPKEVHSLKGLGVTSVLAGPGDRFALLPGGKLVSWGYNKWGQLGIAWPESCQKLSTCEPEYQKKPREEPERPEAAHKCFAETGWEQCSKQPEPVLDASGHELEGVRSVAAGWASTYSLLANGEVLAWGNDTQDQLGGTLEPEAHTAYTRPVNVMVSATEPLTHVVAIAAGKAFGLALVEEEHHVHLVGWGDDGGGALGVAADTCGHERKRGAGKIWACDRYARSLVAPEGVEIAQIAAGNGFSAILGAEGKVYTIGSNALGQLGRGPGCEQGGGEMGLFESCYSTVWQAVPGLEHVQAISAGMKGTLALVGAGAAQPLPVANDEPGHDSLKLQFDLPAGETSEAAVYRVWQHPGENEVGEGEGGEGGGGGTEEEGEEPIETGTGEPPVNVSRPHFHVYELIEGERKTAKTETAVGDVMEATLGTWTGTQPITFEYQWLLCKNSNCTAISGARSRELVLTEEDAGHTIELKLIARNGTPPHGVATSEPSEVIKAEGEGRNSKATKIKLEGADGTLIGGLEQPEYEVKLETSESSARREKVRVMVLRPGS